MLALKRRVGQNLVLYLEDGRRITILFIARKGQNLLLGIDAPSSIRVLRGELRERENDE